jgi:hypothetical protein
MPLRGRDAVLRSVGRMLDQARGGHGRLVLVTGEAGIGKTALVREAAYLAQKRHMEVAWGACLNADLASPFAPWLEILGPEGAAVLVRAGGSPAGAPDPQEEEWRRFLAFHAVADQLQSRAARKGLLVVLEDLHWAGTPAQLLLLLLRYVAAHLGRLGSVLLLGTCREAELEPSAPVARLVNGAEQLAWVALTPPRLATSSPTSPTSGSVHRLRRVFSGPPVASLLRHAARSSGHRPCCPAPGPDHPSRD